MLIIEKILCKLEETMIYKLLTVDSEKYIYDAYDNITVQISDELFDMINNGICNHRYHELIEQFGIRDIYQDKHLSRSDYVHSDEYKWQVQNSQKQLVLSITENCNMRCEYCGYYDKRYEKNDHNISDSMSEHTLKAAIKKFLTCSREMDVVYISFYGGEPLLKFDLIQTAVKFVREMHYGQKICFTITTNGLLLTPDIVQFFVENDFTITISLDGPKYVHDKYRLDANGNGTYTRIINNIMYIKKNYINYYEHNIRYNVVLIEHDKKNEIVDFFYHESVSYLGLSLTNHFREKYKDTINYYKNKEVHLASAFFNVEKDIRQLIKFCKIGRDDEHKVYMPAAYCLPYERKVYVTANGSLYPCEKVPETANYMLGNLEDWNNIEAVSSVIEKSYNTYCKKCANCWAQRFCGMCFANESIIEDKCDETRANIEKSYSFFLSKEFQESNMYNKLLQIGLD